MHEIFSSFDHDNETRNDVHSDEEADFDPEIL
jgi:hypothetical protein